MLRAAVLALGACGALAGCDSQPAFVKALFGAATPAPRVNGKKVDIAQWTEEVELHDGRTVTLQRKVRAYAGGFPNSSRGSDVDTELRAEAMGIAWRDEISNAHIRHPISFEIFDGTPYLVLQPGDRAFCAGKPPQHYLAQVMRWTGREWAEVALESFPLDQARTNLHTRYWGHGPEDDARGVIAGERIRPAGGEFTPVKRYLDTYHRTCQALQQ